MGEIDNREWEDEGALVAEKKEVGVEKEEREFKK